MFRKMRILVSAAMAGILLVILLIAFASAVSADPDNAILNAAVNAHYAQPGDVITVNFTLSNMDATEAFNNWQIRLGYNPAVLEVDSCSPATLPGGNAPSCQESLDSVVMGQGNFAGDFGPGPDFDLGTIAFTVTTMGNSNFTIITDTMADTDFTRASDYASWLPGTINADQVIATPYVQFSSTAYEVEESVGVATITVTLNATPTQPVTISYATSDGSATVADSDYNAASGELIFASGEQWATFPVIIISDTVRELKEIVNLALVSPENANLGSPSNATLIILDDDNQPPDAVDDIPSVINEDSGSTAIDVLNNDDDPDPGDTITITQVTQGNNGAVTITEGSKGLTYIPYADYYGEDTFDYTISDGILTDTATVTVTVNPINDAPFFVKGPDQTVIENSGPQTVSGWATGISAGPVNEFEQTLTLSLTNDNNALFSTQPDVGEASGDLTFTPYTDTTGSAMVTVTLNDDGGTTNGGQDTYSQTFGITVTAGNKSDVTVVPLSLNAFLESGSSTTSQLLIGNAASATADLIWSMTEIPTDVNWLSETQSNGTTSPGVSDTVTISFSATDLGTGTYHTQLQVNSNDPDEGTVNVNVQMEVVIGKNIIYLPFVMCQTSVP